MNPARPALGPGTGSYYDGCHGPVVDPAPACWDGPPGAQEGELR
jgi:hypothetical protein